MKVAPGTNQGFIMSQFINLYRKLDSGNLFKNEVSIKIQMNRKSIVKKICLLFAAFCISIVSVFAQDVITMKNGENIQALIQEIGLSEIKYKKIENPNGPDYTLIKTDVLMIKYANGSTDVFAESATPDESTETATVAKVAQSKALSQNEGNRGRVDIMQGNKVAEPPIKQVPSSKALILEDMKIYSPNLYSQYKSGKRTSTISYILSFAGGFLAGYALGEYLSDKEMTDERSTMIGIGGAGIIGGIALGIVGDSKKNRAIRNFKNQFYTQSSSPYFQFNMYGNKIGLAFVF